MPVYSTKAAFIALYGDTNAVVSSDHDASGTVDEDAITAGLKSASREIESHALAYGVVPTDVAQDDPATPGTFPYWWAEACIDICNYKLSLSIGPYTKEKRQRYEDWTKRLEANYPSTVKDGETPTGAGGGKVTIVAGGERHFSPDKVVGL